MSIISLLNEPNTNSPANVDASIMYRRWKEQGDQEYEKIVREQVEASKLEAEKDGVKVPTTIQEYCVKKSPVSPGAGATKKGDYSYPLTDLGEEMDLDVEEPMDTQAGASPNGM